MDARTFEEEIERQNARLDAAMKTLSEMGVVQFAFPEEALRSIDEAFAVRAPAATPTYVHPGVRA